jgi:hypothetical protein
MILGGQQDRPFRSSPTDNAPKIFNDIAFKIMILGRQQGGDRPFRSSPTDNAPKIFIMKAMVLKKEVDNEDEKS